MKKFISIFVLALMLSSFVASSAFAEGDAWTGWDNTKNYTSTSPDTNCYTDGHMWYNWSPWGWGMRGNSHSKCNSSKMYSVGSRVMIRNEDSSEKYEQPLFKTVYYPSTNQDVKSDDQYSNAYTYSQQDKQYWYIRAYSKFNLNGDGVSGVEVSTWTKSYIPDLHT